MPFPFFRLPFDLREMIYKELSVTPRDDRIVTPDPTRTRRTAECQNDRQYLTDRTLNLKCLPFLQTCSQVYEEAARVLYGDNIFQFSDEPHGTSKVVLPGQIPISNTQIINDSLPPVCDFITMYHFLARVSSACRGSMKHIQLVFFTDRFLQYLDEEFSLKRYSGGLYLGSALEVLADWTCVQKLDLSFNISRKETPTAWESVQSFERLVFGGIHGNLEKHRNRITRRLMAIQAHQLNLEYDHSYLDLSEEMRTVLTDSLQNFEMIKRAMEINFDTKGLVDEGWFRQHYCNMLRSIDQVEAAAAWQGSIGTKEGWQLDMEHPEETKSMDRMRVAMTTRTEGPVVKEEDTAAARRGSFATKKRLPRDIENPLESGLTDQMQAAMMTMREGRAAEEGKEKQLADRE